MKLTAIMLVINSFFANQQGVEVVVDNVIQPIQQISADAPLNNQEYQNEVTLIKSAATYCRQYGVLEQLNAANAKLLSYYEDVEGFDDLVRRLSAETNTDLVEASKVLKAVVSAAKNDLILKLTEFEAQVLKRDSDISLLADVKLLSQVVNGTSRFVADFRTLVAQVTVSDVQMTRSFLAEEDVERISVKSSEHFKAILA